MQNNTNTSATDSTLTNLSAQFNKGKNFVSQYLVIPKNNEGISGLKFDVELTHEINIQCDVTDHYIEDNTTLQDHVAIKPTQITLTGYVGELVYTGPSLFTEALVQANERLGLLSAYLPNFSKGMAQKINALALQIRNTLAVVQAAANVGVNLISLFRKKSATPNNQTLYTNIIRSFIANKTLVTVATPHGGLYYNMIITNANLISNEDSLGYMQASITLKQIRVARTIYTNLDPSKYQGRASNQISQTSNNGQANGTQVTDRSALFAVFG